MGMFFWLFVAFIIFSIVILLHEYGHFKTARFFWVKIEEFGLGIPPRAKKIWRDKHGTLFSLNWLPLGGFVKISGENPFIFQVYDKDGKKIKQEEIKNILKTRKKVFTKNGEEISQRDKKIILEKIQENSASYNFSQISAWKQSIIILAWVIMNFFLAIVIFSILFIVWVKPIGINNTIPIETELKLIPTLEQAKEIGLIETKPWVVIFPITGSIAESYGLKENDIILKVNQSLILEISELQEIIKENKGNSINIYIQRKENCVFSIEENQEICESTEYLEKNIIVWEDGKLGMYISENLSINSNFSYKYRFDKAILAGIQETVWHIELTFKWLWFLWKKILFPETETERKEAVNNLSGPIGIMSFISDSVGGWIIFLSIICAIISINLWVFNLLPIPALDGGRFMFIILNSLILKITWKRNLSQSIENYTHVFFFLILIALSIIIAYNDIVKIISE